VFLDAFSHAGDKRSESNLPWVCYAPHCDVKMDHRVDTADCTVSMRVPPTNDDDVRQLVRQRAGISNVGESENSSSNNDSKKLVEQRSKRSCCESSSEVRRSRTRSRCGCFTNCWQSLLMILAIFHTGRLCADGFEFPSGDYGSSLTTTEATPAAAHEKKNVDDFRSSSTSIIFEDNENVSLPGTYSSSFVMSQVR
jgi:hypothetical protein